MRSKTTQIFKSGTHNLLDPEIIPADAAQDSKNWVTKDGRIESIPGKVVVGATGVSGRSDGEHFGYKTDSTAVQYRKIGTKIQYKATGDVWTDVVTGLTTSSDYAFTNYSSLAGAFTYAWGVDGIYKFNNANPGSYLSMYDATKNFKGYAFIDKGRSILWNRPEDKTALYGSKIDPQNSTVYTSVTNETLATGDGSSTTRSGTIANFSATIPRNFFALSVYAPIGTTHVITGITAAASAVVSMSSTSDFAVGDYIVFYGVVGMTQINGKVGQITAVVANTSITVNINSSAFTAYSSGGTAQETTVYLDNYLGGFKSITGAALTGTINYITGAVSITTSPAATNGAPVVMNYQYENSNIGGVTDFTHAATRIAGEGFQVPQDQGGDPIMNVVIGPDGYYSMKQNSAYLFSIDSTDLNPTNNVYNNEIGIKSFRGSIATNLGIVFMNLANPEKPELTILQRSPLGTNLVPKILFPQFKFADYLYDDCCIDTYDRYILVTCRTADSAVNNVILLCDIGNKTVDITYYAGRCFAKSNAILYMGSSITQSTYNLYNGFDDDGFPIENFWTSKDENYGDLENLHKVARIRLKGRISREQSYQVYVNYDGSGAQLVGTVVGTGPYVDYSSPQTIGSNIIGTTTIGGGATIDVYEYFTEIKLRKVPKFKSRSLTFVFLGYGYCDISQITDSDIEIFEPKIPMRYREKQNVTLDGLQDDQPNPQT